jgi:Heparinase II/III-like protein
LSRLIFPSLPWAVESSKFAERELEREIQRQFKKSGINFEGSLPYHRLSTEICLLGVALIKKSGRDVPAGIVERLQEAASFTRYYTDTCEECPIIGDNDSGIFVKFFPGQELNRHQYLKNLFDCILDDKSESDNIQEFLCSLHFTDASLPDSSNTDKLNADGDIELQAGDFNGLIIARYKSEAFFFNTLRSSEGHTHNDKLSIYPIIGRKLVFIDRGSFSYTGFIEKRHEDRMTSSHNGPVINGWEQNRIWENDLFYVNGEAKCDNRVDIFENVVTITGWHTGYRRYSPGMKVFRQVKWDTMDRTISVTDWVAGKKIHKDVLFTWCFLINPIWSGVKENNALVLTHEGQTVYFEDMDGIGLTLTHGLYCPNYQAEAPCQVLRASRTAAAEEKTHFVLRY